MTFKLCSFCFHSFEIKYIQKALKPLFKNKQNNTQTKRLLELDIFRRLKQFSQRASQQTFILLVCNVKKES